MKKRSETGANVGGSRRNLLKAGALSSLALMSRAMYGAGNRESPASKKLSITIAGYDYDRVQALMDGRVAIKGCESEFEVARIGDMNSHVFGGPQTREASEIGLLPYILALANDHFQKYALVPVFPLRVFRHKSIYIRTDRGIRTPADLRGKRIATPGYSSTSLTWIRGILQHEYGVRPEDIQWVVSSKDSASKSTGGASKYESVIPDSVSVQLGPNGKDESELLVDGDVDAVFHAADLTAYREGHPKVARLFSDSREVERAYFAKTGMFPIMHAVAIRQDTAEAHPWLPKALFGGYCQAKQLMYDYMRQAAWYKTSLPWVAQELEATVQLMGENYWPYGVEPNRKALETLLQYAYEQGLAKRKLATEDLFHPSTMSLEDVSA